MEQPPALLENLFMFSLKAMTGRDPLPKSASADFWVRNLKCWQFVDFKLTTSPECVRVFDKSLA
jgi:hypothetical protein